ncbi:MAG: hypothetical protein SOW31_10165 [Treponema sp.]|nr:hypothetical protein [Treponema sp.]
MKRKNFIILLIFVLSLLFSCCWGPKEKADSEIFTSIEPMEWSEDYIVSVSNYPSSILIWDSETNKLVREISLQKEKRAITILDMAILEKSAWIIGLAKSYNLIRIDFETGEFEFKDFSFEGNKSRPYDLCSVKKEEDGIGTIWVKSYGNKQNGTLFSCYNADGTLRDSFCIDTDIDGTIMSTIYKDGDCFMLGASSDYIIVGDEGQENYSILNLTKKTVSKIRNTKILNADFFEKEYSGINLIKFISDIKFYGNDIISVNIVNSSVLNNGKKVKDRCLFKINSLEPFDIDYLGINVYCSAVLDVIPANNLYYVISDSYSYSIDKKGLEINVYNKPDGKKIKEIFIPNAEDAFFHSQNNATWISIDSYKYVGDGCVTEPAIPEICKLDHETGRVFVYSEDGKERELSYTDVSE